MGHDGGRRTCVGNVGGAQDTGVFQSWGEFGGGGEISLPGAPSLPPALCARSSFRGSGQARSATDSHEMAVSPEPVPGACWGWRRRGASRSRSWRGRLPRRGRGLSAPRAAALIAVSTALLKVATSGRELSGGFPVHGPICDHRHLVCSWSPRRYRLHLLVMQN